jgi:hypothetical protein
MKLGILVSKIDDCNKKLERAGKIIGGLVGERQRLSDTIARLDLALSSIT